MRFSSLTLQNYGHFEDCTLAFDRSPVDFHLVFGRNEAGKSTTMSAVRDLLFGYPHQKTYDFRYHTSLQRLGATLQVEQDDLSVRRRRTRHNRDSLVDGADAAMPEGPLLAALHGLSREAFCQRFSLDHARLRDGGRAIVEAKDDVGAALFEAGSGLPGAQRVLEKLQQEADAVWGERRAQGKTYWQAERQRAEAEERLKSARLAPRTWTAEGDRLARLQAAQAEAEGERRRLQQELTRLQRIRRLAAPVAQRRAALAAHGDAQPVFDEGHEAAHRLAAQTIAEAEIKLASSTAACEQAEAARQAVAPDRTLLDRRAAIDDLVSAAGAAAKAAHDLPGLQADMAGLQADADRLAREAGVAAAPLDQMLASLPPPVLLATLDAKATQMQALQTRLDEARRQLRRDSAAREQAAARLAGIAPPDATRHSADALRQGQTAKAVADRLPERRRAVASAERALAAALRRLSPWSGTADALDLLVLPADAESQSAESGEAEAEAASADAARQVTNAAERLEQLELALRQAASRPGIPACDLAQARQMRDAAWAVLRTRIASGTLPDDAALAAYEQQRAEADLMADRRFETAESSARLTALTQEAETAGLALRQARQRQAGAAEALAVRRAEWQARLQSCGVPALAPAVFRRWAGDRLDALQAEAALAQAREAEARDAAAVGQARAGLLAAACGMPQDAAFDALLDRLQEQADAQARASETHAVARAEADAADKAVAETAARVADHQAQLETWRAEWQAAVAESGLPADSATLPALLPVLARLRSALDAAITQQRRIAGIGRDELAFDAAAYDLAAACGITDPQLDPHALTEALRLALQRALQDDRAASEADAQLARSRGERQAARLTIAAAGARLAPLLALAGVADPALLAPAIEASRALRTARDEVGRLEQTILRESEGYSLDAAVAETEAADPAGLAEAVGAVQARIATLDADIARTAQEVGQARAALASLDRGADAALAAADERQARAAMAAEAETYLLKRAQAVMLKWAIDTYRRQQESPLLNRAGALFSTLTLGRYERLDIDRSCDPPRLVGHCADGRSLVGVDGMSDGTADQLFLALRLAALEQSLDAGIVLPFLADDLFINFDDRRAHAGFQVLGEVARRTQVLFFTHHDHLREIAQDALGPHTVRVCELAHAA